MRTTSPLHVERPTGKGSFQQWISSARVRHHVKQIVASLLLIVVSAFVTFPLLWMITSAFKPNSEILRVFPMLPAKFDLQYYRQLLSGELLPFTRQYFNTFLVATVQSLGATAIAVMAGFVFAKYRFRFSRLLYFVAVTVIVLPQQILIVPLYEWINQLGLYNNLWAVILPGMVSGIGILFLTEVIRRVPDDLLDIARIEGASEYRLLAIILPLIRPGVLTYALIHFILVWHEHLVPRILLSSAENLMVSPALTQLMSAGLRVGYAVVMAAGTLTLIPTIVFYLIVRRHFDSTLSQITSQ